MNRKLNIIFGIISMFTLITPIALILSHCFTQPTSGLLSMAWGMGIGFVIGKLFYVIK